MFGHHVSLSSDGTFLCVTSYNADQPLRAAQYVFTYVGQSWALTRKVSVKNGISCIRNTSANHIFIGVPSKNLVYLVDYGNGIATLPGTNTSVFLQNGSYKLSVDGPASNVTTPSASSIMTMSGGFERCGTNEHRKYSYCSRCIIFC